MTVRHLARWLVVGILGAGALAACGAGGDGDGSGGDANASGGPSGPGGGAAEGGSTAPGVPREMPTKIPSLGGYALAPAFTTAKIDFPSALVWPRPAGAAPFVLERGGYVKLLEGGGARTVLDFSSSVAFQSEGGALGMALHPSFGDGSGPSPYAYVWYNAKGDPKNRQRLVRFTWSAASKSFDRASELVLVDEEEQRPEHNAGRVAFGPDGFLYFGNGDDIDEDNHQRLDRALFAGIFRIDVDQRGGAVSHPPVRQPAGGSTAGYYIPNDNPFVGVPGALEEFWALGFRNPFAFSFDRATGDLWAGDVGDTWREEIDLVVKGGNYEWPVREGDVDRGGTVTLGTRERPRFSYSHAEMADLVAVIGGYVYRGKELPELTGKYVFSDWPSARIWALDVATPTATRRTLLDSERRRSPLALAEDRDGEIYVLHAEGVAKLVRDPSGDLVPKRLSETTLFADVAALAPKPDLVPYEIVSPLWSDAAVKRRFVRLPAGAKVTMKEDGSFDFPVGTTFVKHFELPVAIVPHGRTRRLETRVLVRAEDDFYGVTYRWNAAGTDAELVTELATEGIQDDAGKQSRTWHYPSFGQCWSCHREKSRVLGFVPHQLAPKTQAGEDQLGALVAKGVLDPGVIARLPPVIARPSDEAASLEARATAYLAANCSSCHHAGQSFLGGGDTWNASAGVPLGERNIVGAPHHNIPMARALGLRFAPLVDPGNPAGSILLARMKSNDPDLRMPPIARNVVDEEGVRVVEAWIRSLSAASP